MRSRYLSEVVFTLVMLHAAASGATEYGGTVSLSDQGKPVAAEEYADAVVYFVPDNPVADLAPLVEPVEMRMENKTFLPRVLPVTVGTEIRFANLDPILHNAFSTSTNNAFDLGFYGGGEVHMHQFADSGLVRVYCNVHHSMVAYVLVLNTPYYTGVSSAGEFTLRDLPQVPGVLYIWHPRADALKDPMDFAQLDLPKKDYRLELTQRRIPPHLNKEGKSYRKSRERSY